MNTEIIPKVPCVYFISDGIGNCKIGIASDIKDRFSTIQVGNAQELKIINVIYTDTIDEAHDMESEYHVKLASHHVRGEWFKESAVVDYLNGEDAGDNFDSWDSPCKGCSHWSLEYLINMFMVDKFQPNKGIKAKAEREISAKIVPECIRCEHFEWKFQED